MKNDQQPIRAGILWLDHKLDDETDMDWFQSWLDKWGEQVQVAGYCTGGAEHMFDVQGTKEAIADIPRNYKCSSDWSQRKPHPWGSKKSHLGDARDADWVEYGPNQLLN